MHTQSTLSPELKVAEKALINGPIRKGSAQLVLDMKNRDNLAIKTWYFSVSQENQSGIQWIKEIKKYAEPQIQAEHGKMNTEKKHTITSMHQSD